ncbi:MAG: hypothetical protein MN733_34095 [Nitrososphaera sp.]|nr:hypothetical protein [Nitrososphaera sp.]
MGNSKALMLGAVSLIIGMYTLKIKEVDRTVSEIGTTRYAEVQALELAKTGAILAEEDLTSKYEGIGYKSTTKVVSGDTLTFVNKSIGTGVQQVTATAKVGGQSKTVVTVLTRTANGYYYSSSWKEWSRWATTKTYVQP